jgi:hypothetical protein
MGYHWVMEAKKPIIIKGQTCWRCSRCGEPKSANEFYKDKRTPNGLKSQCKKCHTECAIRTRDPINARKLRRESMRRQREIDPQKFRLREKEAAKKRTVTPAVIARRRLNYAVRSGKIVKPEKCENCGKRHKLTAHHEDYSKPFSVEWLCYECHGTRSWKD